MYRTPTGELAGFAEGSPHYKGTQQPHSEAIQGFEKKSEAYLNYGMHRIGVWSVYAKISCYEVDSMNCCSLDL